LLVFLTASRSVSDMRHVVCIITHALSVKDRLRSYTIRFCNFSQSVSVGTSDRCFFHYVLEIMLTLCIIIIDICCV
jgi:hypothetical protein